MSSFDLHLGKPYSSAFRSIACIKRMSRKDDSTSSAAAEKWTEALTIMNDEADNEEPLIDDGGKGIMSSLEGSSQGQEVRWI